MQSPEEAQAIINQVKAESYDQISGLNRQLNHLSGELNKQNQLVGAIISIVAPDGQNLTAEQLLDKLRVAFHTKHDAKESNDGSSSSKEGEETGSNGLDI